MLLAIPRKLFILLIFFYKYCISPLKAKSCIYQQSCSDYAIEAFKSHSLPKALHLSLKRILSCHPFKKS